MTKNQFLLFFISVRRGSCCCLTVIIIIIIDVAVRRWLDENHFLASDHQKSQNANENPDKRTFLAAAGSRLVVYTLKQNIKPKKPYQKRERQTELLLPF